MSTQRPVLGTPGSSSATTMSLTKAEKAIILSMWGKISTQADAIGTQALER